VKTALLAFAFVATLAAVSPTPRAIDPTRSSAHFSVQHIWVEHVQGTVPILGGSVVLATGSVIPVSVTAVLDATRLATEEPDRDRALASPDFFDTKKFPRWTFTSARIAPRAPDAFEMDGNLTIHGVTQPERLDVTVGGTAANPLYHATAQIDRRAFGMNVTRLDPTIGAMVEVALDVALE
jgi:polyisoprenoid-binding protein YceI